MTALTRDYGLKLLRDMVRVRRLEERCAELYTLTKIRGFLHLYIGQEAVATGVLHSLGQDDAVVATYREHGHALLKGISANAIMAEMYGKQEGCSGGRGGSMHLFDAATRFYGGNAIVAGGLPIAVGLALADLMQGRSRITCCFFGDGAAAEGAFHEALNLAVLWQAPVLFVCENNLYAMGTALRYSHAMTDLASRAAGYGLPSVSVDGMDVLAVEEAARTACASVRAGRGPYFIEALTYRFRAHSMFDPELYRTKAEVAEWKKRDPIDRLVAQLREAGLMSDDDLETIERDTAAEVDASVAFAEAGTWEPVATLARFVHSEGRTL